MTLGLLSRSSYAIYLPKFIAEYSGDTLWAALVFFGISIFCSHCSIPKIALASIIFSFAIEVSQLYHEPWIDNIRHTTLGGLVLGFGFKASDLLCYIIGISLGASISFLITYKFNFD